MSARVSGRLAHARLASRRSSGPAQLDAPGWDLGSLYAGLDDPRIARDIEELRQFGEAFSAAFRGRLDRLLGSALHSFLQMKRRLITLHAFADISSLADKTIEGLAREVEMAIHDIEGQYFGFFENEVALLDDATVERLAAHDELVRAHLPWINEIREGGEHLLGADVESALRRRDPYGPYSWSDGYTVMLTRLRCEFEGSMRDVTELEDLSQNDPDPSVRAGALEALNGQLRDHMATYSALTLNVIVGEKKVDDRERGYAQPHEPVNGENRIPDAVMDRFLDTVFQYGGKQARRFVKLKAQLLGVRSLNWVERFAPVPALPGEKFTFAEARALIERAYGEAFPALLPIVREMFDDRRIDAERRPNKWGGDCTYAFVRPDGRPTAFTQSNFRGDWRSVLTLAHELGHACHEITALGAYGPLMGYTPVACSEIAAVLCEISLYRLRRKELEATGDRKALMALLLHQVELGLYHVVDQCMTTWFERSVHDGRQRDAETYSALSLQAIKAFYGDARPDFTYRHMDASWAMLDNVRAPFTSQYYVLAHLCAEGIEGQRERLGDDFLPRHAEFFRESGVRPVVELMRPFGIDLTHRDCASPLIEAAIDRPMSELEDLGKELNLLPSRQPR